MKPAVLEPMRSWWIPCLGLSNVVSAQVSPSDLHCAAALPILPSSKFLGRRGSWHAMRASTDRRQGIGVWPIWSRERCARSSAKRKSSRTRCATILNRDAEFEQKMAEVLCVYREVEVLKKA